jgi:thiol:disulfide interchange protein DsbC
MIGFAYAESNPKIDELRAKLVEALPNFTPDAITKSALPGFYEVAYGTKIVYVSDDGRYVIDGVLVDLEDDKKNLTEVSENEIRKQYIDEINKQESITFGAEKPKHVITVFTDIDCQYCRKLHKEMDQYASYGIQVKYLLFPRSGLQSAGYQKSVSIWCSDDRKDALTRAKAGEQITQATCENPVAAHYQIGNQVGVTGTPAILTADGRLLPGYLPAQDLAQRLDEK